MSTTQSDPNVVKLSNVRLSYPQLWEKKSFANDPNSIPAYSANFILDKKANARDIAAIRAVFARLVAEEFGGKGLAPDKLALRDGTSRPDTDGYSEATMYVSARDSKTRPGVVDRNLAPLAAEDGKPYAGCYVNATVRFWAQGGKSNSKNTFGKRINCQLRNVQFVKDGEPFGEKATPAEQEFSALPEDGSAVDQGV